MVNKNQCILENCQLTRLTDPTLRLFHFPTINPDECAVWLRICGLESNQSNRSSVICENHFDSQYLGVKFLKPGAVPTLNLPKNSVNRDYQVSTFNESWYSARKRQPTVRSKCIIPHCRRTQNKALGRKLYLFPVYNTELYTKWLNACRLPKHREDLLKKMICNRHFRGGEIGKRRLVPNACPSLYLRDNLNAEDKLKPSTKLSKTNDCDLRLVANQLERLPDDSGEAAKRRSQELTNSSTVSKLSTEDGNLLANKIIKIFHTFYGFTASTLAEYVFDHFAGETPAKQLNPSAQHVWIKQFLKFNPSITVRPTDATSDQIRLNAEVQLFYTKLQQATAQLSPPGNRNKIFTVDETVLFATGKPTTVCCAVSAGGIYVPPMFMFYDQGTTARRFVSGPSGAIYHYSTKPVMTKSLFLEWLKHFIRFVRPNTGQRHVVLVLDSHTSRRSLAVLELCEANGILVVALPPLTVHRLQPLKLSVFGPLSAAFNQQCPSKQTLIRNEDVAAMFKLAMQEVCTRHRAKRGFQMAGIYPLRSKAYAEPITPIPSTIELDSSVPACREVKIEVEYVDDNADHKSLNAYEIVELPTTHDSDDEMSVYYVDCTSSIGSPVNIEDEHDSMTTSQIKTEEPFDIVYEHESDYLNGDDEESDKASLLHVTAAKSVSIVSEIKMSTTAIDSKCVSERAQHRRSLRHYRRRRIVRRLKVAKLKYLQCRRLILKFDSSRPLHMKVRKRSIEKHHK